MDLGEDSSRFGGLPVTTSRNMSTSSSQFFSANQSPFFSPRSPALQQLSESTRSEANTADVLIREANSNAGVNPQQHDRVSSSTGISNSAGSSHSNAGHWGRVRNPVAGPASMSSSRMRSCDVFIGLHGRKPPLLRFVNWLRAELEVQGISCFVSDRARLRNSRKHVAVEKAMDAASFGVVVITSKSFRNPYSVEEIRLFSGKKNLVPIFFDVGPGECLARDIVEKRGDLWERNGGEVWAVYGGVEKEWREAVDGLRRVDEEWKLEAQDGNWRDCILKSVALLAARLGRRSVVDRLTKWRERAEKDEFPFPRNEGFVGRKREIAELEFILFGDVSLGSERDYFELKAKPQPRRRSPTVVVETVAARRRKGKEPVVWKESEKEIEMEKKKSSDAAVAPPPRRRRKRWSKIMYGKGIACVSGDPGIGKTELVSEFAYRYHQRYKMVLWIGGESRYIRQNYLNLWSFLEVDVGIENSSEKPRIRSFEEQEEAAISRIRKELMRNIPFLVVIDNLDCEKDWWDGRLVMDLLPRFGGETHVVITTRLPRILNLEPMRLSYLSGAEAMAVMMQQGDGKQYSTAEIDALRTIEDRLGRSTLGLAIVGAILAELPITPTRLLDATNRMPAKDSVSASESRPFLSQLFEVCFSIFDHADRPRSLATRMIQASGWFAPSAIPVALLAQAANRIPDQNPARAARAWRAALRSLTCGLAASYRSKSEAAEASAMLLRFNFTKSSTKPGSVHVNESIRSYARKRSGSSAAAPMVHAVVNRGTVPAHSDHVWAACFLLFGFGRDPVAVVELKVPDLLQLVKQSVLPLAVRTFVVFSRCSAALELLRLCTNALEAAEQAFVTPVEKWIDRPASACWRPIHTKAQLNPCLWQELALARATVLEARAKLMLRGGQFDVGDDLIRKTVFIRTSICGEDHPHTAAARETLSKITRLLANVQIHTSL